MKLCGFPYCFLGGNSVSPKPFPKKHPCTLLQTYRVCFSLLSLSLSLSLSCALFLSSLGLAPFSFSLPQEVKKKTVPKTRSPVCFSLFLSLSLSFFFQKEQEKTVPLIELVSSI